MLLRDYQQKAINEIRDCYAQGIKRLILQQPTGSGKSVVFCYILKSIYEKGKSGIVVVKGRSLVDNASKVLLREGVPHTVIMSGFPSTEGHNIYVCSIDTLYSRRNKKDLPSADMIIIDEIHMATSKSNSYNWLIENYKHSYILGTTATPWIKGGLRHVADKIIYPISVSELIEQKYLVPLRYFTPVELDISEIKITKGEFDDASSIFQFEKQSIYIDIISTFQKHCMGGPTFCFAINIAHAHKIQVKFSENNINTVVITADTSLKDREFFLRSLADKKIECIISVGTMTTGVDIPELKNIIICRPTKSKNLHIQMLGRSTRIFPGKEDAKIFDLVGNVSRHGFLIDERIASLDAPNSTKSKTIPSPVKACPACYCCVAISALACPECGHVFVKKIADTSSQGLEGVMEEIPQDLLSRMKFRAEEILLNAWKKGHKPGTIWFRLLDEFGEENARRNYQIYRKAKARYEDWFDGRTPAPCPRGIKETWGAAVVPPMESYDR